MNCQEVTKLISDSLDRELPLRKRIGVWLHFAVCRCCARYQQNLRLIKKVIRLRWARPDEEAMREETPGLSVESRERMKKMLKS